MEKAILLAKTERILHYFCLMEGVYSQKLDFRPMTIPLLRMASARLSRKEVLERVLKDVLGVDKNDPKSMARPVYHDRVGYTGSRVR